MRIRSRAAGAALANAASPYLILLFFLACTAAPPPAGTPAAEHGAREAVLLTINDVYRIEGVEGGATGGLTRVRALREELEREHPDLILLHAGDLLFPSLLSRLYKGEQMIDVLNRLDGDPTGFDRRMFAVFGNHEFERDKLEEAALLDKRVEDSQFTWVSSNVVFRRAGEGSAGEPLVAAANLVASTIVESGGLRIGLFGLTVDVKHPAYVESFTDPVATARERTAALRAQGADVVVALTHLTWQEDEKVLRELGPNGPDLIVGGHDHEHMAREVGGRWLVKADADARTATVVRLRRRPGGGLEVSHAFQALAGDHPAPDPALEATVDQWLQRHEREFCGGQKPPEPPDCLDQVLGRTRTPLVGEETVIRREETSLGDFVADRMVEALAGCGAQAAFVNSGTLRLNQDLPAGSEITRRHLEELFGFPAPLRLVRLDGRALAQVAQNAVEGWPGQGKWLQVSGLAYVHDADRATATNLTQLGAGGPRPIAPDDELLVATTEFLLDPKQGQDGYTMLGPQQIVDCAASGQDLKAVVRQAVAAAEPQGIAPRVEGRICAAPAGPDCKAVR